MPWCSWRYDGKFKHLPLKLEAPARIWNLKKETSARAQQMRHVGILLADAYNSVNLVYISDFSFKYVYDF